MSVTIKKVLISDSVDPKCQELLKANGIEVTSKTNLSPSLLISELKNCDGLIVRSDTKVTKEVIEVSKSLKVIGRAGTGVDNIDTISATKNGVIVLNAPNGNSVSACELACAFISCLARDVAGGCQSMKEGKWARKAFAGGSELAGKTLAVIGLGRIGKEVAIRMKSYGMKILGYDPFLSAEEAKPYSINRLELHEIWPVADYITVHTPLIPQTKNLINDEVFAKCKIGVKIVNAARGGIVNEESLFKALESGICSGAALDVFTEEPPSSEFLRKLISHSKVIATPHLGASTHEAQTRVAVEVAEQFVALNDSASPYLISGVLNAPALLASRQPVNVPWIELAQQMGHVLWKLTGGSVSMKGAVVRLGLHGSKIRNMKFLNTAALLGILSSDLSNEYNLINTPAYAKAAELDINVEVNSMDAIDCISLAIQTGSSPITIRGTVHDDVPYLLQIHDAVFPFLTVPLKSCVQIYSCETSNTKIAIAAAVDSNDGIRSVSVAHGKLTWIIVLSSAYKKEITVPTCVKHY